MRILLDTLHEDLNRKSSLSENIQHLALNNPSPQEEKKTSQEQWESIQGNRGSVISDLCGGQTRNILKCANCNDVRILYEMFMDLSIPLPNEITEKSIRITVILAPSSPIVRYVLKVNKDSKITDLLLKLQELTGIFYNNLLFGHINQSYADELFFPKSIQECFKNDGSDLYAFEVM